MLSQRLTQLLKLLLKFGLWILGIQMASNQIIDLQSLDDSAELQVLWENEPQDETTDYNVGHQDLIDLRTPDLINLVTPNPGQEPPPGTPGIPETPPNSPAPMEDPRFEVELSPRTSTPIGTPPPLDLTEELESSHAPNANHSGFAGPSFGQPSNEIDDEHMSQDDSSSHRSVATLDDGPEPSYDYPPAEHSILNYSSATQHDFFCPPSWEQAMLRSPAGFHGSAQWQPNEDGRYAPDYDTAAWMILLTVENGYARQVTDNAWAKSIAFSMLGLQRKLRHGHQSGALVLEPSLSALVPRNRPLMIQGPEVAARGCAACPECLLWYEFDAGGNPITMIWLTAPPHRGPELHVSDKSRYGISCLNEACRSTKICISRLHPLLDDGYFPDNFLELEYSGAFLDRFDYREVSTLLHQSPLAPPAAFMPDLTGPPVRGNALTKLWKRVTDFMVPEVPMDGRYGLMDQFLLVPHELRWTPAANGRAVFSPEAMRSLPLAMQVPLAPDAPNCEYGCPNCLWVWGMARNRQRTHVFAWYPVCPLPDSFQPARHADLAVFVTQLCPNPRCTQPQYPILLYGPVDQAYFTYPARTRHYRQQAYFDLCCNPGRLICSGDEHRFAHPYSLSH